MWGSLRLAPINTKLDEMQGIGGASLSERDVASQCL